MRKPAEAAHGYGLRVGGCLPYLSYCFSHYKSEMEKEVSADYHKVVKVVLITKGEWKRLKKLDKRYGGKP